MAQGRSIRIPFALGQDEATTPKELPRGAFREVINVRQRRGSALGQRADYLGAQMSAFGGGTLVPFDLYGLGARLFALGDVASQGVPTDLFEFVEQPGGAWKGTLAPSGSGTRVPPLTALRNVGQVPDAAGDIKTARIAATGGLVCMAYGFGGTAGGLTSYVHVFRASTDSTILFAPVPISNPRVVVAGDSFWIIGVEASNDLVGYRFDTASGDDELQSVATLYTGTVSSNIYSACTVTQNAGVKPTTFSVFVRDGSGTVIRHFDESGTQTESWSGPAVAADALAIEADATSDETVVVTRVGTADASAFSYTTSTNSLIDSETALFGENVSGDLTITRTGSGENEIQVCSEASALRVLRFRGTSSPISGTVLTAHNWVLGGDALDTAIGTLVPVVTDDSAQLAFYDRLNTSLLYVCASIDPRISRDGGAGAAVGAGGQVCTDATTSLCYWARILEGTDGQQIPAVTEFEVASTARRQACQVSGAMFLTGAVPLSFDARQVVENNFLERPVFASSTPGAIGGSLISGAEYDYVAVYKWTDGQNRLAQSRVSEIQTITLGASDTGVTHTIYAPHTMRRDSNTGSAPIISLYRTDASAAKTKAELQGAQGADPPVSSLNGLDLELYIEDPTGSDYFLVTFGAGDSDPTSICATINAVTSGRILASPSAGRIKLESVAAGAGVLMYAYQGAAAGILGLPQSPTTAEGTTTFTKGSIFQLAAFAVVPLTDDPGEQVTVIDLESDADLLEKEPLYTQGEDGPVSGILQHEAAPPCRFCAAVGARVFVGGLPDPSEVAISKELAPAEALAFSSAFAFRALVDGAVTAVAGLDGIPIAFTADAIYRFPKQLPNDQGSEGELGPAIRIPSEGGCDDWRSILETSHGLFYKARDGKLMLLPRGDGSPVWIGERIRDSLASFPTITATAYSDEDHCALFACQAAEGLSSIILVFDLRIGQWYRDTFASAQVIRAATSFRGRLAYIDTATVRLQSSSLTPSAFIEYSAKTGSFEPFGAQHGLLICVTVEGEFRGDCQVRCRISYDDGVNFTNLATKTLTTSDYAVGESLTLQWWPRVRKGSTFVLDFQVLTNGTATPGVLLNSWTPEIKDATPIRRRRTSSTQRG